MLLAVFHDNVKFLQNVDNIRAANEHLKKRWNVKGDVGGENSETLTDKVNLVMNILLIKFFYLHYWFSIFSIGWTSFGSHFLGEFIVSLRHIYTNYMFSISVLSVQTKYHRCGLKGEERVRHPSCVGLLQNHL